MSVSYKMTLTRSWGNETKALGNKIQSVQKWLLAGNGNNLATGGGAGVAPAFNYILMRGLYRITFVLCDMGKCIKSTFWKKEKTVQIIKCIVIFFTTLALHNILKGLKLLYEGVVTTHKDKKIPTLCLHENE